jgi:hypothetical protein
MTQTDAKNLFQITYGSETYHIVRMIHQGYRDDFIQFGVDVSNRTLAAYKANYTRGTYDKILNACKFPVRWTKQTKTVVSMLRDGMTTREIASKLHLKRSVIVAYAANFTRGAYDLMA